MIKRYLYKAPNWFYTLIVTIAIVYLTLFPHPLPDNDIKWWEHTDKVIHALMFGGFTAAAVYDYIRRSISQNISVISIVKISAISVAFGGMIEIAQTVMNIGRSGDIYDFYADITGVIFFALISKPIVIRFLLPAKK